MNTKFPLLWLAMAAGFALFACKKTNDRPGQQLSAGTGSFTVNNTMFAANDTLGPDPFSGKQDLTMSPATGGSKTMLFIYNMPTASSGTIQLTDGNDDTTVFILGHFPGINGTVNFSSNGVTGSLTKTGATSFTFTATVYDEDNPSTTYSVQGSGSY